MTRTNPAKPKPIRCPNCGKAARASGPWGKPDVQGFQLARGWFCNSCGTFTRDGDRREYTPTKS